MRDRLDEQPAPTPASGASPAAALRAEARVTAQLAWPVVLTQLSMMAMGVVDTIMVGRLGAVELGAAGIGRSIFFTLGMVLVGVLLSLEPLVGQAYGAGKREECGRSLWQGIWLALLLGAPLTLLLQDFGWALAGLGQEPAVVEAGAVYLAACSWAAAPLLIFTAHRAFLNAVGSTRAVLYAALAANVVNVVVNYGLIFGRLGMPELGIAGAGYATSISQVFKTALAGWLVFGGGYRGYGLRLAAPSLRRARASLRIGIPIGLQIGFEIGAFTAAAVFAGWIGAVPLAAHQVVVTISSVTFMVPLGISVAASVRVAQLLGRGDPAGARRAGLVSLGLGSLVMLVSAAAFLSVPALFVRLFTDDPEVIALGVVLVRLVGVFQLSDGLQAIAAGCLRGAADTRVPMLANLVAHWVIGLPLAYLLAFPLGMGAPGLWVALTVSLTLVGVALTLRFLRTPLRPLDT